MPRRAIVVTGGAEGIGRAVALLCAARGDQIAILDKAVDGAKATAEEAAMRGASDAFSLFTSAAVDVGGLVHELPAATWRQIVDTNLDGTFFACKHALRKMREGQASGSIVCASSPTGFVALAAGGTGAYSATKGAVSSLVRCMAIDYARYGIRVNAVVPGATETRLMWNNVPAREIDQTRAVLEREIPLGRLAQPEEPARAVVWLLSEESSYVTGSHLVCDGGILAKSSISV
jgi:NAD(P)-dependent dehydrogenase (short-subunit alcohol dehydrogenase family)